jgi:phage-related baseplate assembly protein
MTEKPTLINSSPANILNELIADYQSRTVRVLQDAQAERLLINSIAYALSLHASRVNEAALSQLVAFSRFPVLDRLADLVGVKRLSAANALTTLEFTLVSGHSGVVIPQGTRVASNDGQVIFLTSSALEIPAGQNIGEVSATAQTEGANGNGFLPDSLTELLDPQPFVTAVTNVSTSAGGADEETDEQLRERIVLAPASFSTAGSRGAYIFHAKTASQLIVDVAVTSPVPGTVNIYPMVSGGGTTPPEILEAVDEVCSGEKVRPLSDTVVVLSPTTIFYDIEANITLYTNAQQSTTVAEVQQNLTAFKNEKGSKLGRDIILNQIIAQCTKVKGVYEVEIQEPLTDIIVSETQVAICLSVTVNVVGLNDG